VRVASWPRDRLGYFEPFLGFKMRSLEEAQVVSAPLDLEGKAARVFLNVGGLSEQSQIGVEVLSERFEPISGYTREECAAPREAGLRQPVLWRDRQALRDMPGPVRLRVTFGGLRPEDVRLYALYVEECD
jgi:hypothetical protein